MTVEMVDQAVEHSAHARTLTLKLQTVHVIDADLTGWVLVVAGEDAALGDVSRAAMAAGAAVGVVSTDLADAVPATVRFRADPRDPDAWWRIAMHIEQHLGPIDGVATDVATEATVREVFDVDLRRRNRAPVVVVNAPDDADTVLTALTSRPPAVPSPPAAAGPDQ